MRRPKKRYCEDCKFLKMEHVKDMFYDFLCKKHPYNLNYPISKGISYEHCSKYADNCEEFEYNFRNRVYNRVRNFFKRSKLCC